MPAPAVPGSSSAAAAALLLAGAAGGALALSRLTGSADGAEAALSTTAWLLGWTLLIWAVVATGVAAVASARHLVARRRPSALSVLLLLAATVLVIATAVADPLVGAGSASA